MNVPLWAWAATVGGLAMLLLIDLLVVNRNPHEVALREAAAWCGLYVGAGIVFGAIIWAFYGGDFAGQYLAGYLVEESLSVDNLFVFVLIMSTFAVPIVHQYRVLLFGVVGALVLRGLVIAGGVTLLDALHWIIYVFGGFLILTGVRLAMHRDEEPDLTENRVVRLVQRVLPATNEYHGGQLVARVDGRRLVTPLALVMVVIAVTNVIFAVDSIPAVFGVTREPFIVFTSNAFALVGLRSAYFLLAGAVRKLVYLNVGLAAVLVIVGLKMVLEGVIHVSTWVSLAVIVTILAATVIASLRRAAAMELDPDRPVAAGTPVG
jgi:tellurite resistance protein TerC